MVSVLLPTAARASLLRMALQSIAEQTALAKISHVFVSENGSDRASELVCREFPQLPITYIFREPAVEPVKHAQLLMKECLHGKYTCILHDDDWWTPTHVEDALAAFEANPDASVYGANLIVLENDVISDRNCELFPWFAADYPAPAPVWRIPHLNVLLGLLLGLVIHYSSMVMGTEALRDCAFVYDTDNPFDNDRMILFALSLRGPVLFGRKISVGVRHHPVRDSSRFALEERFRWMSQTTRWMIELGRLSWSQVASAFVQRLIRCPMDDLKLHFVHESLARPWCLPEIARHLDRVRDAQFFAMYDQLRLKFTAKTFDDER